MSALPRSTTVRLLAGLCGTILAGLVATRCVDAEAFEDDVHTFGRYQLCLSRVVDTCHPAGEPCTTGAAEARSVLLGTRLATGEFFYSRGGAGPVVGRLVGSRFEVTHELALPSLCKCAARVRETITGELELSAIAPFDCGGDDAGLRGCTGLEPEPPEPVDAGAPADAGADAGFAADAGIDPGLRYASIRLRIVDEVVGDEGATGCTCLPCRVEYDVIGRP